MQDRTERSTNLGNGMTNAIHGNEIRVSRKYYVDNNEIMVYISCIKNSLALIDRACD